MSNTYILKDIRFWIILFFAIRLIGITNPPLEVEHNWRQSTVTMVARNFLEIENNILFPRIDIAGEKTGITGMEFPLLNYIIYISAKLFGYQHWYGRLINLIISSFGLYFFHRLVKKYFSEQLAFYSTMVLAGSIWFQFSRKIMPDTFSISMIIAGIYYGSNYLDYNFRKHGYLQLISYTLLVALGTLSKLPSGYLLVVFGVFYFNKNINTKRKITFSIASFIAVLPAIGWYYYWVPHLVHQYSFWHFFMGKSFEQGFYEIIQNLNLSLSKFYDSALKFIGFTVFSFGLLFSIIKKKKEIYLLFTLCFLCFSIIIFKAGYTFSHHSYYIIPFIPVMALVTGYGLTSIRHSKITILLLSSILIEGIANQQHDFRIKEKDKKILNLEKDLNTISSQEDLILINSGSFPTPMYFAHRKGWINSNEKIQDNNYINTLRSKGLKHIVILKKSFGTETTLPQYQKVLDNENYCIYSVSSNLPVRNSNKY